jgi:hypothetical protein
MNRFTPPRWEKPAPIGYGPAAESVYGVAAPLLAGFSLAATLAVSADDDRFRWPGAAMLAFSLAAILLLFCLQCGFTARQYLYSASDVRDWWPDLIEGSDREEKLRSVQAADFTRWEFWSGWTRRAYNSGLFFLLSALALALAPPRGDGAQTVFRWVAMGVALVAAAIEVAWMLRMFLVERRTRA